MVLLLIIGVSGCYSTAHMSDVMSERGNITERLKHCIEQSPVSKPGPPYHILERGETLYRVSRHYKVSLEELYSMNNIADHTALPIGTKIYLPDSNVRSRWMMWPVKGELSSRFGPRPGSYHYGIDISAKKGTSIRAAARGLVTASAKKLKSYSHYGRIVIIEHGDGMTTLYAHNKKNHVKAGQCVKIGDKIAEVGNSGNASGSHLHFEVREKNRALNPVNFLP